MPGGFGGNNSPTAKDWFNFACWGWLLIPILAPIALGVLIYLFWCLLWRILIWFMETA